MPFEEWCKEFPCPILKTLPIYHFGKTKSRHGIEKIKENYEIENPNGGSITPVAFDEHFYLVAPEDLDDSMIVGECPAVELHP